MNRFHQGGTNQRVVLASVPMVLQQEEETAYFLNNLELKRPNIISRSTNSKYRLVGIQPQSSSSRTTVIDTHGHTVTYTDDFGTPLEVIQETPLGVIQETPLGLIQESIPIELFTSTEALIVPKTITFPVTELSLTLEPTVVSQPVPAELPVTYDSTCVSQAISTPIVSPVVSSHHHLSEYTSCNVQNTTPIFTVSLNGESELSEDTALPIHIIGEETSSIYLTTPVTAEMEEVGREGVQIPEKLNPSLHSQNQMRMEAQEDGSFMLYMDDLSSEPIHLGPDTEIIQTDAFPVIPNEPVELPSEGVNGETESFILVPIDDEGNTVLLPTSFFDLQSQNGQSQSERECTGNKKIGQIGIVTPNQSRNQLMPQSHNAVVVTEKPKPFRYDLPEESDGFESDDFFMNVNHMSTVLPHLRMNQVESSMWETESENLVTNAEEQKGEVKSTELENEPNNLIVVPKPVPNSTGSVLAVEDLIEETSKGTFKCKYCNIEARLRVGILNHINRCHKDKPFNCSLCDHGFELESMLKLHTCVLPKDTHSLIDAEVDVESLESPTEHFTTEEVTDDSSITASTDAKSPPMKQDEMEVAPIPSNQYFSPPITAPLRLEVTEEMMNTNPHLTSPLPVSPNIEKDVNQKTLPTFALIGSSPNQSDDQDITRSDTEAKVSSITVRKRKCMKSDPNLKPQRIECHAKLIKTNVKPHLSRITVEPIEIPGEANVKGKKIPKKKVKVESNKMIMTRSSSRCLRNSH